MFCGFGRYGAAFGRLLKESCRGCDFEFYSLEK
jgi:hypothetical protein